MLTLAEQAKTVFLKNAQGTLSTLSSGYPFGSLVNYSVFEHQPILFLSRLAEHTQNLLKDNKVSLFVTQPNARVEAMEWPRVTLLGRAQLVDSARTEASLNESVRDIYLKGHPKASLYLGFPDFSFYQIQIESVRFVGGFGSMGWVQLADFLAASSDPVADLAEGVIEHMNCDHQDAMLMIARHQLGESAPEYLADMEQAFAEMLSVNKSGYQMRVGRKPSSGADEQRLQVKFQSDCHSSKELRLELVRQTNLARESFGEASLSGSH